MGVCLGSDCWLWLRVQVSGARSFIGQADLRHPVNQWRAVLFVLLHAATTAAPTLPDGSLVVGVAGAAVSSSTGGALGRGGGARA